MNTQTPGRQVNPTSSSQNHLMSVATARNTQSPIDPNNLDTYNGAHIETPKGDSANGQANGYISGNGSGENGFKIRLQQTTTTASGAEGGPITGRETHRRDQVKSKFRTGDLEQIEEHEESSKPSPDERAKKKSNGLNGSSFNSQKKSNP